MFRFVEIWRKPCSERVFLGMHVECDLMSPNAPRVTRGHHRFEHHHQRIYLVYIASAPGWICMATRVKASSFRYHFGEVARYIPRFNMVQLYTFSIIYILEKLQDVPKDLGSTQMVKSISMYQYTWHILGHKHPWTPTILMWITGERRAPGFFDQPTRVYSLPYPPRG